MIGFQGICDDTSPLAFGHGLNLVTVVFAPLLLIRHLAVEGQTFPAHQPAQFGVLAVVVIDAAGIFANIFDGKGGDRHGLRDLGQLAAQHGREQRPLVAKVVVNPFFVHTGRFGDLLDRRAIGAEASELGRRRFKNSALRACGVPSHRRCSLASCADGKNHTNINSNVVVGLNWSLKVKHTILICGYGPGISQAVARRFGQAGHPVAAVARNAQRLAAAIAELTGEGIQARAFPADLGDVEAVRRVVADARAGSGPIGILHWNGFLDVEGDLLSVSLADLNRSFEVRVAGYIAAVQASLADLEAHRGSVLATSGIMALDDPRIDAFATGYGALAIGVAAQHKATGILAHTLAPRGVHVGEVIVNGFVAGTPGADGKRGTLAPAVWPSGSGNCTRRDRRIQSSAERRCVMGKHVRSTRAETGAAGQPVLLDRDQTASGGAVILLVLTALFVLTQLYLAIPLLAPVGQTFSPAMTGAVTFALATCFSLAYAAGFLIWGPLSDQYGRRPVMLTGLAMLSVATLACAFAPALSWLAALRAAQGLVASSFAPVALAWLAEAAPARHRATAIGAMSTSFLVAGIFGQVLAAWLALHWDWTWVFLVTGGCLVAAVALTVAMVREPARASVDGHLGHRFAALGRIAMRPAVLSLSCAHITLLLSFVAMYTALGPHLGVLGLDPSQVILLRLVGLPGMFAALLAGRLAARISMPGLAAVGYAMAAAGLALEAVLSHSLAGIAIGSLAFVTGVALAVPAMITQYGALAMPNRAAGMALNGFILFIGASIGPLIAAQVTGFVTLLAWLAVALLLSAVCVAGSAILASTAKTP